MTEAFICDAVRTPIGRYGGALSGVRADDLAAIPIRALKERNHQVDWLAAAPTRLARTAATWRGWRDCWPGFPTALAA